MYHEPSTFSHDSEHTQQLKQLREDNDRLSQQLKTLASVVFPFLPPYARSAFEQQVQ